MHKNKKYKFAKNANCNLNKFLNENNRIINLYLYHLK